jgi:AbrB family looped-hinge helix DNA binding protein
MSEDQSQSTEADMELVTISPEYRIEIPKGIREKYHLEPNQRIALIDKGGSIAIVPDIPIEQLEGFAKGIDTENIREKTEREL